MWRANSLGIQLQVSSKKGRIWIPVIAQTRDCSPIRESLFAIFSSLALAIPLNIENNSTEYCTKEFQPKILSTNVQCGLKKTLKHELISVLERFWSF